MHVIYLRMYVPTYANSFSFLSFWPYGFALLERDAPGGLVLLSHRKSPPTAPSNWMFRPHSKISVKPLYLSDVTVVADTGVLQQPNTFYTDLTNSVIHVEFGFLDFEFRSVRILTCFYYF
jgi:hypothetical protein